MALVSSGTIQLGIPASQPANRNISSEFGNTPGADSISEYYRGGAYVPNSPFTSGIPTSGQISFSNFYGAARYTPMTVNIGNLNVTRTDCSRPYSFFTNRATNLSVSGGNGSYSRDWDGPNSYQNLFGAWGFIQFQNIDNQTAANINIWVSNNSSNFIGEYSRRAFYNVTVNDGTTSVNRSFSYTANLNAGCR
jgi:hypothetical protein